MAEVKPQQPRSIWFLPIKPYRRVLFLLGLFFFVVVPTVYYMPTYREHRFRDLQRRLPERGIEMVELRRQVQWDPGIKPYIPGWFDQLVESFRAREITVRMHKAQVDRAIIAELFAAGKIKALAVRDTPSFDDEALSGARAAHGLEELFLRGTGVSGRGLRHLQPMPALKKLYVESTPSFDDEALLAIGDARKLESLHLKTTRVSAQGFRHLQSLAALQELTVMETPSFDDEALGALQGLPLLKGLHLSDTGVTAQGLRYLKSLPSLKHLWLRGVEVSAEDLQFLETLPLDPAVRLEVGLSRYVHLVDLRLEKSQTQPGDWRIGGSLRSTMPLGQIKEVALYTERRVHLWWKLNDPDSGVKSIDGYTRVFLDVEIQRKEGGLLEFLTGPFDWDHSPGSEPVKVMVRFQGSKWEYIYFLPPRQLEMPGKKK